MNQLLDRTDPNHAIDKVLTGLRNAPIPSGLAARVNARVLQASETPVRSTLFPSPLHLGWATAACATILLALLATHRQPAPTLADLSSETPATQTFGLGSRSGENRVAPRFSVGSLGSLVSSPATNRVPQGFSLGSHRGSIRDEGVLTPDPDAIALAETLAPSHPAPPLPLTAEEALLLRSTRQGQPIEIAELENRRNSVLIEIAEARERATVREYIHGLLGPLAAAQTLTPPPSPSDDPKPVAESETPPSQ